jgi:hypothetical protein
MLHAEFDIRNSANEATIMRDAPIACAGWASASNCANEPGATPHRNGANEATIMRKESTVRALPRADSESPASRQTRVIRG